MSLAPLPGWSTSSAWDVNSHGSAIGYSWTPNTYQPTLWDASGTPQPISIPGSPSAIAVAINNAGLVVGRSGLGNWAWDANNGGQLLAPLGLPSNCYVRDVNESGQLVGGQAYSYAWRFDLASSTLTYCGTLSGLYSEANAVNNLGHVVGRSMSFNFGYDYLPFLWTPEEGMFGLGSIEAPYWFMVQGSANGVNDRDEVVGAIRVLGDRVHAFLWDRTYGMRDLNVLVRQRGPFELREGISISNTGWIVGKALDTSNNDAPVTFVLRPR